MMYTNFPDGMCFGYVPEKNGCSVLTVKECEGPERCSFYKSKERYEKDRIATETYNIPKKARNRHFRTGDISSIDF